VIIKQVKPLLGRTRKLLFRKQQRPAPEKIHTLSEQLGRLVSTPASYSEVSGFDLSSVKAILSDFSFFSSVPPGKYRDSNLKKAINVSFRIICNPFIHYSSCHSTLYSLRDWQHR
jgi:hypothetical protein